MRFESLSVPTDHIFLPYGVFMCVCVWWKLHSDEHCLLWNFLHALYPSIKKWEGERRGGIVSIKFIQELKLPGRACPDRLISFHQLELRELVILYSIMTWIMISNPFFKVRKKCSVRILLLLEPNAPLDESPWGHFSSLDTCSGDRP